MRENDEKAQMDIASNQDARFSRMQFPFLSSFRLK